MKACFPGEVFILGWKCSCLFLSLTNIHGWHQKPFFPDNVLGHSSNGFSYFVSGLYMFPLTNYHKLGDLIGMYSLIVLEAGSVKSGRGPTPSDGSREDPSLCLPAPGGP